MILYFNKYGQLLEQLEYGQSARVGMTDLKIFAYFEGVNVTSIFDSALIRFRRPDLEGSEYPDLYMQYGRLIFNPAINNDREGAYFKSTGGPDQNGVYYGYVFDFSKVTDTEGIVRMLDTPGMWEASITLIDSSTGNFVTGLVRFNVAYSVSSVDDEAQNLGIVTITRNTQAEIASRLTKRSLEYVRYCTDFINDFNNNLLSTDIFVDGCLVYDLKTQKYYLYSVTVDTILNEDVPGYEPFDDRVIVRNDNTALSAREIVTASKVGTLFIYSSNIYVQVSTNEMSDYIFVGLPYMQGIGFNSYAITNPNTITVNHTTGTFALVLGSSFTVKSASVTVTTDENGQVISGLKRFSNGYYLGSTKFEPIENGFNVVWNDSEQAQYRVSFDLNSQIMSLGKYNIVYSSESTTITLIMPRAGGTLCTEEYANSLVRDIHGTDVISDGATPGQVLTANGQGGSYWSTFDLEEQYASNQDIDNLF